MIRTHSRSHSLSSTLYILNALQLVQQTGFLNNTMKISSLSKSPRKYRKKRTSTSSIDRPRNDTNSSDNELNLRFGDVECQTDKTTQTTHIHTIKFSGEEIAKRNLTNMVNREFNASVGPYSNDKETRREYEAVLQKLLPKCKHVDTAMVETPLHVVYGDNITIGTNLHAQTGCVVSDEGRVTIGNNVFLGPGVHIYSTADASVVVEDGCWIGGRSVVCPGVQLGKGVVVSPGSVVCASVPDYSYVSGSPALVLSAMSESERKAIIARGGIYNSLSLTKVTEMAKVNEVTKVAKVHEVTEGKSNKSSKTKSRLTHRTGPLANLCCNRLSDVYSNSALRPLSQTSLSQTSLSLSPPPIPPRPRRLSVPTHNALEELDHTALEELDTELEMGFETERETEMRKKLVDKERGVKEDMERDVERDVGVMVVLSSIDSLGSNVMSVDGADARDEDNKTAVLTNTNSNTNTNTDIEKSEEDGKEDDNGLFPVIKLSFDHLNFAHVPLDNLDEAEPVLCMEKGFMRDWDKIDMDKFTALKPKTKRLISEKLENNNISELFPEETRRSVDSLGESEGGLLFSDDEMSLVHGELIFSDCFKLCQVECGEVEDVPDTPMNTPMNTSLNSQLNLKT